MSQNQISIFTEDESEHLSEGFRVNHTAKQVNDLVKKMIDTSGRKCLEQFEKFNRHGLWAKTYSELLIGMTDWFSMKCKLTWKMKGTKYNRTYFQLAVSTLPTSVTDASLLPTPMAQQRNTTPEKTAERQQKYGGERRAMYLEHFAVMGLLPTPRVGGQEGYETRKKRQGHEVAMSYLEANIDYHMNQLLPTPTVQDSDKATKRYRENHQNNTAIVFNAHLLPTPASRDYKGANSTEALAGRGRLKQKADSLPDQFAVSGKTSQLNPLFVAEMMGFPTDWTVSPLLSGEKKA